jgi:hypothetical protein
MPLAPSAARRVPTTPPAVPPAWRRGAATWLACTHTRGALHGHHVWSVTQRPRLVRGCMGPKPHHTTPAHCGGGGGMCAVSGAQSSSSSSVRYTGCVKLLLLGEHLGSNLDREQLAKAGVPRVVWNGRHLRGRGAAVLATAVVRQTHTGRVARQPPRLPRDTPRVCPHPWHTQPPGTPHARHRHAVWRQPRQQAGARTGHGEL